MHGFGSLDLLISLIIRLGQSLLSVPDEYFIQQQIVPSLEIEFMPIDQWLRTRVQATARAASTQYNFEQHTQLLISNGYTRIDALADMQRITGREISELTGMPLGFAHSLLRWAKEDCDLARVQAAQKNRRKHPRT
jgi:hypothetical protein